MAVVRTTNKPVVSKPVAATNGKAEEKEKAAPRTQEEKASKFKEIGQRRTRQVVKIITGLGNLSNKGNYDYTPEQVAKIFGAIENALKDAKEKFEQKAKAAAPGFEL